VIGTDTSATMACRPRKEGRQAKVVANDGLLQPVFFLPSQIVSLLLRLSAIVINETIWRVQHELNTVTPARQQQQATAHPTMMIRFVSGDQDSDRIWLSEYDLGTAAAWLRLSCDHVAAQHGTQLEVLQFARSAMGGGRMGATGIPS
jgi:hypothetical protein